MNESTWKRTIDELRSALVAEADPNGVALEAESTDTFGAVVLDTVVEAASGDAETQRVGYRSLCDLLATRLAQHGGQVLGCLVIDGDPDPGALAEGLDGMLRPDGTFTPVLPLSSRQANELVDADVSLFDVVDPATALLEIAASRKPPTAEVASTALAEIDELVARHTSKP